MLPESTPSPSLARNPVDLFVTARDYASGVRHRDDFPFRFSHLRFAAQPSFNPPNERSGRETPSPRPRKPVWIQQEIQGIRAFGGRRG